MRPKVIGENTLEVKRRVAPNATAAVRSVVERDEQKRREDDDAADEAAGWPQTNTVNNALHRMLPKQFAGF